MSMSSNTTDHDMTPLDGADPLCTLSAGQLGILYRLREVSPTEVTQAVLERAEEARERFGAFVHIDAAGALAAAQSSARRWKAGEPLSPIDGVPSTIKDVVWVKNWAVRLGSLAVPAISSQEDSPSVARLRAAGTILVGLTTTPEFGWKGVTDSAIDGITRNPWNPQLTPGGSSGGASAAAAFGAGVLHLGSDGGGSIRMPASFAGVVGFKPTFGQIASYPASSFTTLAHIGPLARTVDDAALMFNVMAGHDRRDWYQSQHDPAPSDTDFGNLAGLRIGYWSVPPEGTVEEPVKQAIDAVVARLEKLGADVRPVSLPQADLPTIFRHHWYCGIASRVSALSKDKQKLIDPGLAEIVEAGRSVTAIELVRAQAERAAFGVGMEALFDQFDLIISPAVTVLPFTAGRETPEHSGQKRWIEWAGFTYPINLSQQPACVIPAGLSPDRRPVGLQLIGPRGADQRILAAAKSVETMLRAGA